MKKLCIACLAGLWISISLPTPVGAQLVCDFSIDPKEKHGDSGSSLRLEYNVSADKAFNGFWMKLGPDDRGNNFDASGYKTITLWIKGDAKVGIPGMVKVEVKGDAGDIIGKYYIRKITPEWAKVEVPLEVYVNQGVLIEALNELTICFENKAAAPSTKGAIWVDEITLEGDGLPKIIADFNNPDQNNLGGRFGTFTP